MEIYLSHMVFFKIVERLGLTKLFENNAASFVLTMILTLAGTILFAAVVQWGFAKIVNAIRKVYATHAK